MAGLSALRVEARNETFRIVQLQGNLLVCSRGNGSCCCGWEEKGRLPFDNAAWGDEWERRKIRNRVHLTFTGCLGPCATGNNALLQLFGTTTWFKDLNDPRHPARVFDYIEACLALGTMAPLPVDLTDRTFERYLGVTAGTTLADDGLAYLDPVCLMEVDPATARWTTDYDGRTIGFCAPACRKQFLADPAAYVTA